jgi:hypothetical protein
MSLLREHYPISWLCEILGLARSSAYYQPRPDEDRPLRNALVEVDGQCPTYGYRRVTEQLQRHGHAVNTKRVRRLMQPGDYHRECGSVRPRRFSRSHRFDRLGQRGVCEMILR